MPKQGQSTEKTEGCNLLAEDSERLKTLELQFFIPAENWIYILTIWGNSL